ncbi:hypothetical protein Ping_2577 [Psychromonas ingrahamii 37]|uniref:Uncharacterized protein n=1 Tax=Psychromonas ingrahamii (strain DSM 17664 / CCUG 51855 / 37) TaxID=357804 RepID=A1SXT3_PSYIN|nr:hypothetical protein [Psychromonas ingrahamii]ABM04298.1 hypothetical protein Ping_2577 [Psychromonas ingrahamii 37]
MQFISLSESIDTTSAVGELDSARVLGLLGAFPGRQISMEISDSIALAESNQEDENKNPLTQSHEKMMDIFGRFKEEKIELNLFTTGN